MSFFDLYTVRLRIVYSGCCVSPHSSMNDANFFPLWGSICFIIYIFAQDNVVYLCEPCNGVKRY